MAMDILTALDQAAQATSAVARGVRTDQLSRPTTCPEWDVKSLMQHLTGSCQYFQVVAAGQQPGQPEGAAHPAGSGDAAANTIDAANASARGWKRPGAFEGTCQLPFGEVPKQVAAGINLMELYVHGWDLAKATGQQIDTNPELVAIVSETSRRIVQPEARQAGAFGQEVSAGPSASGLDRLVAFLGRKP